MAAARGVRLARHTEDGAARRLRALHGGHRGEGRAERLQPLHAAEDHARQPAYGLRHTGPAVPGWDSGTHRLFTRRIDQPGPGRELGEPGWQTALLLAVQLFCAARV